MNKSPIVFMSISGTMNIVFLIVILLMAKNIIIFNLPDMAKKPVVEKTANNNIIDESEVSPVQSASAQDSFLPQSMNQ